MVVVDNQNRLISRDWTWPSVDKHKLYVCECMRSLKKSRRKLDIHESERETVNFRFIFV